MGQKEYDTVIYPSVAGNMLVELNKKSKDKKFTTESLAAKLNLDQSAFKRLRGVKNDCEPRWPKDSDPPGDMKEPLQIIAKGYPGPQPFAQAVLGYLKKQRVHLETHQELETLVEELPQSWSLNEQGNISPKDPFGGNRAAADAFDRFLTLVTGACVLIGPIEEYAGVVDPGDTELGAVSGAATSAFGALMLLVLGRGAMLADGEGWQASLESDGKGPVCVDLPDDAVELAVSLLPDELLDQLRPGRVPATLKVTPLFMPNCDPSWQGKAARYFTEDGGHRFTSQLLASAQCLLAPCCADDAELLSQRIERLFDALAAREGHEAARESYSAILSFGGQYDAPCMMAAATLSTLVGVERTDVLRQVL
jgi:hypothetical protein